MPYQTGQISSWADAIAVIKSFAQANGWSVSGDVIYKGDIFAAVYAGNTNGNSEGSVRLQGGTGQSGGALTGANGLESAFLGGPLIGDPLNSFPMNYHLFCHTSPDQISMFVNYNNVWWQCLTFGEIQKYFSVTGGQFYHAPSNPATNACFGGYYGLCAQVLKPRAGYVHAVAPFWIGDDNNDWDGSTIRLHLDGKVWWRSSRHSNNDTRRVTAPDAIYPLHARSNSAWNEMTVMLPYYLVATRPESKLTPIGTISHFRHFRMDNHVAGDIVTFGSDKYKVFPWLRHTTGTYTTIEDCASGVWGVAVEYDGP